MVKRQDASTGQIVDDGKPSVAAKPKKDILQVKVHSPFKVYFEGEADSVSAENNTGPFDILPKHHKFITLLNPCDLVVRSSEGEKRIRIARGIMHVKANTVNVFLDV
jgi:F0F1-type ATP synthase epsilon subunit